MVTGDRGSIRVPKGRCLATVRRMPAVSRTLLSRFVVLGVIASFALTGCSRLPSLMPPRVIEPRISPQGKSSYETVDRSFTFGSSRVRLQIPVDSAVYAGSKNAQKSAIFFGGAPPKDWISGYYRAFISEKHQSQFYASLVEALHSVRDKSRLGPDRYVELVMSMVQEMEYRTDQNNLTPKFPIETFGDGYGDCDDKTLLAAALLSQDGYDVSVLVFTPERHVALGIRAPGLDYKGTGYAYVESTAPSLVGVPPEQLSGGGSLTSPPEVIRIGSGKRAFASGSQITYIENAISKLRSSEKSLQADISSVNADLSSKRSALLDQKRQIESSDPHTASGIVDRYNREVAAYNDLVARQRELVARYNGLVGIERYVAENASDRPGIVSRLREAGL